MSPTERTASDAERATEIAARLNAVYEIVDTPGEATKRAVDFLLRVIPDVRWLLSDRAALVKRVEELEAALAERDTMGTFEAMLDSSSPPANLARAALSSSSPDASASEPEASALEQRMLDSFTPASEADMEAYRRASEPTTAGEQLTDSPDSTGSRNTSISPMTLTNGADE